MNHASGIVYRASGIERWADRIVFLAIYILFFYYFKPSLILSATTVAGGDTGAHHYIAKYMKDSLLPHWKLSGWATGWYAGIPMLYFYFPMAYVLIALLSYIIPYQIAFKVVTILGIFLLPAALYWCMRWCGFSFPMPATAASLSLPLLFLESHSIFGGNIPSTLAGEFSFSISFALSFFFIGLILKGLRENRFWIINGILLSFIVLFHILPVIVLVISMPFLIILSDNPPSPPFSKGGIKKNLVYLLKVFTLGFCLSAFWSIPFIVNISYIAHMKWIQLKGIHELFPKPLWPAFATSCIAIFLILKNREKRLSFFLYLASIIIILYFSLPDGKLWNARFLPYFYAISIILSAYTLTGIVTLFKQMSPKSQRLTIFLPLITFIGFILLHPLFYIPDWIKWNYSGYESKKDWGKLKSLMDYLDSLPYGRVMWEYRPELDKFGTPRVLELIPYFTKQPTMEGLLMESSITAPLHFYMQAETTKKPTHAIGGLEYPSFSFERGVKHMRLFNIRYFIAFTDEVRREADKLLKHLKRIGEFSVYELEETGYVNVAGDAEYMVFDSKWREHALSWLKSPESFERPIIFVSRAEEKHLKEKIASPLARNDKKNLVPNVTLNNDSIEFDTDAVDVPHIVRISYFPNWKAEGARGPYLASPSLMAVIPEKKHVRLNFARRWPDWFGIILTWSAWGFVLLSLFIKKRSKETLTEIDVKKDSDYLLSVVIPAYNEEKNIKRSVEEILLYTKEHGWKTEVVIVDDGSNDDTWEIMKKIKKKNPDNVKILKNEMNEGKGSAVKKGLLNCSGKYVVFTDADFSYNLSGIDLFLKELSDGYDVVIGSRKIPGSESDVAVGNFRKIMSKIFNGLVNLFTGLDYSDTQCGFKGFSREASQEIFRRLTIKSFAFDAEALYIATKIGKRIKEIPVTLIKESHVSSRLLMHSVKMMCDIMKIRFNDLLGRYRA